jgi:hypothetical protein
MWVLERGFPSRRMPGVPGCKRVAFGMDHGAWGVDETVPTL